MPWGHSVETVLHGCGSAKHVSPSGQVSCDRPGRSGVIALAGRSLVIALKWAGRLIAMTRAGRLRSPFGMADQNLLRA